jgi:hypothetical protein
MSFGLAGAFEHGTLDGEVARTFGVTNADGSGA